MAGGKRRRVAAHDIPDALFIEAKEWLEKGGTKKGACDILSKSGVNVGSNKKMEELIQEWEDRKVYDAEMRKRKRGTSIEGVEAASIIEDYFAGISIADIADQNHRSQMKIKSFLEENGALLRATEPEDPNRPWELFPPLLDESTFSDEYKIGDIVWVAGRQCFGEVTHKLSDDVYRVWLLSGKQMYIPVEVWNLANVERFREFGVDPKRFGERWERDDVIVTLNEALKKAKLNAAKDAK
ncbi:hypothetical protein PR1_110 [Providencia phage vB_PreS_PR1]|uniref:D2 protein n=1 Tax=Providencia phage vB_PreS_PR1 TaxID=1931407 RepID=A0A1S6KUZ3_9CAUD|nr:helicase [Providencia phage vB_PreS_PR1]AQT25242.1 hypothetical protein PR1_110 [Providencia phage vB_PreS_PR1]